jgi:RsiW-degrading membrane proteinase PrsW (M82 family)
LWVLAVVVTDVTGNANLIPTVVLLGSFLVPVSFVAWAFDRRDSGEITTELLFRTFIVGGVLGVLAASVLENYFLHPSAGVFLAVGLIEEGAKLAALAFVTRHLEVKSTRDGMILGATVGLGFAALESAGYAMAAMITQQGLSLSAVVSTELVRGLMAPFGHGLWTAILGGVLFSRSTRHHFLITGRVLAAYLGVSILHALWDSTHTLAVALTLLLTGQPWQDQTLAEGRLPPLTAAQVRMLMVLSYSGLAILAVIGLLWLVALIRTSRRSQPKPLRWSYRIPTSPRAAI